MTKGVFHNKVRAEVQFQTFFLIKKGCEHKVKPDQRISHRISSIGKWEKGELLLVQIRIPMELGWIERVKLSIGAEGERTIFLIRHIKNEGEYAYFEETVPLETHAIYHYYFSFEANGQFYYYKKSGNENPHTISQGESWKLSVGFQVPDWAKGAIMYHIFVDRYRRGSKQKPPVLDNRKVHSSWEEPVVLGPDQDGQWNVDFYGGDILGIEETLEYLQKLGVSILFLSPIVYAISNHRYDTKDYRRVDPYVGNEENVKALCKAAHKRGMYVILDAVFNHTGNDSVYFNEYGNFQTVGAFQSKQSPYFSWYRKVFRQGKEEFDHWWGMKNLPVCDGNAKEWQEFVLGPGGVIDDWFSWGIDGLRLDVADELTDFFIEQIHLAVKRNKPDGFILGEVWKNPMRMNRTYLSSGKAMHSVMNYQLVDALFRFFKNKEAETLKRVWKEIQQEYPTDTIFSLMNFTSTHDISRAIEFFGGEYFRSNGEWVWNLENESIEWVRNHQIKKEEYRLGKQRLKIYYAALTFLPGIVSIFYGDEVGMTGIGNLANRGPYPWKKRDKELLKFFREMGMMRKRFPFLKTAESREIEMSSQKLVFEREGTDGEKILVMLSNEEEQDIPFEVPTTYQNARIVYQKGVRQNVLAPGGILVLYSGKEGV